MKRQQGVALLQVLFLSVILTVMLVAMHSKARMNVEGAQQLLDRTNADLQLYSADNKFKLLLLSQSVGLKGSSDGRLAWNLYNEPFDFAGVSLQVQDIAGLVSLYNPTDLAKLLTHFSSAEQAQTALAVLADWEDADTEARTGGAEQADYPAGIEVRNGLLQTEDELQYLQGFASLTPDLLPWLVSAPQQFRNPLAMPEPVLTALYGEPVARRIQKLRQQVVVDEAQVNMLLMVADPQEYIYLPSGSYRVTFTSVVNNVKLSRRYLIRLSPYLEDPFTYWEYINHYHAETL